MNLENFIEILGRNASNEKVQEILKTLNLSMPVLDKGEETAWFEMEDSGYDLAFKDEASINNDKFADIGDGELIFMTAYFNKPDKIVLPYMIKSDDTYETIVSKIGRIEDDDYVLLHEKSWLFKTDKGIEYIIFFTFNKDYSSIKKLGVIYSYGQLDWVKDLQS